MRPSLASTAVLVLALTTACGTSDDSADRARATPTSQSTSGAGDAVTLSAQQVREAAIPLELIGEGFTRDDAESDGDGNLGCLSDADVKKVDAVEKVKNAFEGGDAGIPFVASSVASLESVAKADETLAGFRKALSGCTEVDTTNPDGGRLRLRVTTDDTTSGPGATAQFNLTAVGNLDIGAFRVPFGFRVSLIQVGNNFAYSGYGSISPDISSDAEAVANLALARLVAVAAGDTGDAVPQDALDLEIVSEADIESLARPAVDDDAAA